MSNHQKVQPPLTCHCVNEQLISRPSCAASDSNKSRKKNIYIYKKNPIQVCDSARFARLRAELRAHAEKRGKNSDILLIKRGRQSRQTAILTNKIALFLPRNVKTARTRRILSAHTLRGHNAKKRGLVRRVSVQMK